MQKGERVIVYLLKNQEMVLAETGQTVDASYQVEGVTDAAVHFVYLRWGRSKSWRSRRSRNRRLHVALVTLSVFFFLAACAHHPSYTEGMDLIEAGNVDAGLAKLDEASKLARSGANTARPTSASATSRCSATSCRPRPGAARGSGTRPKAGTRRSSPSTARTRAPRRAWRRSRPSAASAPCSTRPKSC